MFPGCDPQQALKLCAKYSVVDRDGNNIIQDRVQLSQEVLSQIVEEMYEVGYEKAQIASSMPNTGMSYDFDSMSWKMPYHNKEEVQGLLMDNFPYLSHKFVELLLAKYNNHHAPEHKAVCATIILCTELGPMGNGANVSCFVTGTTLRRSLTLLANCQKHALWMLVQPTDAPA